MPNPEAALRDSIHLVDAEMTRLGSMSPQQQRFDEPVVPDELNKTVTFAFSGPLDEGVRKLADTVGYKVEITPALAPVSPLIVNVTTGFVTVLKAFAAIGDAAGTRALVRVDPLRHLVEVIHHA
jgi:defect-in-organelle-trafficking protein DotD